MIHNPDLSPDQSSCSSVGTGELLISSTRVLVQDHGDGAQPVHITVQRLRDPLQLHRTEQNQTRQMRAQPKPDDVNPDRRAAGSQHDKNRSLRTPSSGGQELLTSCFTTGQRQAVFQALRQCCHSAPCRRREVSVQLLEPNPIQTTTDLQNTLRGQGPGSVAAVQTEPDPSSGHLGDTSNTAAVAAAAAAVAAAAAPLMKAQSDIEAQVSQLAEGVQRLLHINREPEGRSLSQQTLQQLEMLQKQQLQLQSQLLESAIRIVTDHAPMTSVPRAGENSQNHRSSAAAVPVTMETGSRDLRSDLTRDPQYLQSLVLTDGTPLQSLANESQEAVRRANEMLREMESLKTEIKTLLTQPEDSGYFTRPAPEPFQIQQNQLKSRPNKPHQNPCQSHQNQVHQPSSDLDQSYQHHPQEHDQLHFQHKQLHQNQSKNPESQQNLSNLLDFLPNRFQHLDSHQTMPQHKQSHHNRSKHPKSHQNQSKDQNLHSNQTGSQEKHYVASQNPSREIQAPEHQSHQFQSGLVQRRPVRPSILEEASQVLRQARRRKKVLEDNLETLLKVKTGEILHCQLEALAANRDLAEEVRIKKTVDSWISTLSKEIQSHSPPSPPPKSAASQVRPAGRGKPVSMLRPTGSKAAVRSRGQRAGHQAEAEPSRVTGKLTDSHQEQEDRETYLTRLYGKLPHEGVRRTLKRSPYPRFSSPASPPSRKPRPRLVESIRGVTVKSCKTQTNLAPPLIRSRPSSHDPAHLAVTPADSFPVAMAIPLGRPRMDSSSRRERSQEVASVFPVLLSPTAGNMNDNAHVEQQQPETRKTSSSNILDILEADSHRDEEESIIPGTECQFVSAMLQEEVSDVVEEAVVLEGGPAPAPVQYHGPVFPPGAPSSHRDPSSLPDLASRQRQEVLENRLVEWVEQQLMSRMISEIYQPPLPDPAHNQHTDQSEHEKQCLTSDIVEAAGGAGLQLFVDSNVPVDSELIRRLVNEVLAETVAQILGQRSASDAGQEPGVEAPEPALSTKEEKPVPVVLTPVPTPLPSLTQNSRETTPVSTPLPSRPSTPQSIHPPEPITASGVQVSEPVTTPASTPEPQVSEESPPTGHRDPPPLTWGDAELPLEEERPEEHLDPDNQQLIMSVAEKEPPVCSPLPPPPPSPPPPLQSVGPEPGLPSSSSEDLSSSSSLVTAETEGALKHVSEGELLISMSQFHPPTEDEVICSFSSSLQEMQEMDIDPPTYEEVRGRNLLLTLLDKMAQGVTHRGERLQPEGSWGREEEVEEEVSVGEVREYKAVDLVRQNCSNNLFSQAAGRDKEEEKPPIRPHEEQGGRESPGAAAETDSSTPDVF